MATNKILLIIQREFNQRVRKRSFIIMTILTPLLMVAMMGIPVLLALYGSTPSESREVVVIDSSGVVTLSNNENLTFTPSTMPYDSARTASQYGGAFGFLVVGENIINDPSQLSLYTREGATMAIENSIRWQVSSIVRNKRITQANVPGLDSIMQRMNVRASLTTYLIDTQDTDATTDRTEDGVKKSSTAASMGISYIMGFITYMFIFIYGAMIMQGVIEEKSNRIVEIIISSVRPFQLMMGKIIGVVLVALTQFSVWVILVGGAILALQQFAGVDTMPQEVMTILNSIDTAFLLRMIGFFLIFFTGGYMLYASMFAAVGSAVENVQDAQQLQMPITIPLILSIVVMMSVTKDPHSTMAFWMSIIPFTSPIIMIARIPYGVPLWELVLSITVLYATCIAITAMAAKIYRTGILMYGKKPTLLEMIRWIRYKG